jgi:Protein of unknown function (DUF2568)
MKVGALPRPLHIANEGLAFLLELLMLGALAWWGAQAGGAPTARVLLGIGAPRAAAIAGVLAVKVLAFGAATAAIDALGRHRLAILFAVVVLLNTGIATADRNAAMRARS